MEKRHRQAGRRGLAGTQAHHPIRLCLHFPVYACFLRLVVTQSPNLKERFWNTHSGIRTLTAEDVREGLRNAGKCALEHLEVHARSISHQVFKAGVTVREPSMRGRSRIPELRRMAARTRKLGEVVIDKLKFLNPNKVRNAPDTTSLNIWPLVCSCPSAGGEYKSVKNSTY